MIKIKMFGIIKKYMPTTDENGYWCVDEDGVSIGEVIARAHIPPDIDRSTILVNKVRRDRDYILHDGDVMTVMPLVAGG